MYAATADIDIAITVIFATMLFIQFRTVQILHNLIHFVLSNHKLLAGRIKPLDIAKPNTFQHLIKISLSVMHEQLLHVLIKRILLLWLLQYPI